MCFFCLAVNVFDFKQVFQRFFIPNFSSLLSFHFHQAKPCEASGIKIVIKVFNFHLRCNRVFSHRIDIFRIPRSRDTGQSLYCVDKSVRCNIQRPCFDGKLQRLSGHVMSEPDWLLIYEIFENTLVLMLYRAGSHSELFK